MYLISWNLGGDVIENFQLFALLWPFSKFEYIIIWIQMENLKKAFLDIHTHILLQNFQWFLRSPTKTLDICHLITINDLKRKNISPLPLPTSSLHHKSGRLYWKHRQKEVEIKTLWTSPLSMSLNSINWKLFFLTNRKY